MPRSKRGALTPWLRPIVDIDQNYEGTQVRIDNGHDTASLTCGPTENARTAPRVASSN